MPEMSRGFCALIVLPIALIAGCSSRVGGDNLSRGDELYHPAISPKFAAMSSDEPVVQTVMSRSPRDLRVMSFNVRVAIFIDAMNHWNFRKELLLETIRNFNPDVLGTQEAVASQADYLRQQLTEYEFIGAGRNDGNRRGEMCGVYFKRNRFDLLDSGHFWLSETPNQPGSKSWGSSFPRMCTWVKLRDRAAGNIVCLFNTHFDHRGQRAREESAKLMRRKIQQIAGNLPVLITGDFNAGERTRPYQTLIAGSRAGDARFVDTFRAYDRTPDPNLEGTRHDFNGRWSGPRIDWIVTNQAFETVYAGIDHTKQPFRYPSDHFPVTAIVRVAPSALAQVE